MHVAWLFNWAGKPWLTQKWARGILDAYYGHNPADAYLGDEDQGQMSAWFVMSAMGLFQTDGGCRVDPIYELGSPLYPKVVLHLSKEYYGGKTFTIVGPERLTGEPLCSIRQAQQASAWTPGGFRSVEVVRGGTLELELGPQPNEVWAATAQPPPQPVALRESGKAGDSSPRAAKSTLASAAAGLGTIWPESQPPTNCPFKPTKSVTASASRPPCGIRMPTHGIRPGRPMETCIRRGRMARSTG